MLIAFTPDCATTVGSPSDKTVSVKKTVRLWIEKSKSAEELSYFELTYAPEDVTQRKFPMFKKEILP